MDRNELRNRIVDALKQIHDPEIPVNIYDLGLIYDIDLDDEGKAAIRMTLTAPACPVAGTLPGQVEQAAKAVEGVSDATVELVWDPPWSQERMSEEARLQLGLM
ncbi:SUF system Fe-S cluster assembly protein [Thiolapillus sp.]